MAEKRCPACKSEVPKKAQSCPDCGLVLRESPAEKAQRERDEGKKTANAELAAHFEAPPRAPGTVRVVLGLLLVLLYLLMAGTTRGEPDYRMGLLGGMVMFGIPGSLLFYFGLRARYMKRNPAAWGAGHPSTIAMVPGFVVLVACAALGGGWWWGLGGAAAGFGLFVWFSQVEQGIYLRALYNEPHAQLALDRQLAAMESEQAYSRIAALVRAQDVDGLSRAFSQSNGWQEREVIAAAFGELSRSLLAARDGSTSSMPALTTLRIRALRSALGDVLRLCRAEATGGSYRDNCVAQAESLLRSLGND